jgi:hypothetical protein
MNFVLKSVLIASISSASPAAHAQERRVEPEPKEYSTLRLPVADDCTRRSSPEEVIVCGRTGRSPFRLPLPVEPLPGSRTAGEIDQLGASEVGSEPCTTVGPNGGCGGYIPILPFVLWVVQSAVKYVEYRKDD